MNNLAYNLFTRLLKEIGAYHHFSINLKYNKKWRSKGGFEDFFNYGCFERWIDVAFCWVNTPQGHQFWEHLDSYWARKCAMIREQGDKAKFSVLFNDLDTVMYRMKVDLRKRAI